MENDFPNQSTSQLLIKHTSEAAIFTDPVFAITACNPAASALFHYNQQDIKGYSISFLVPTSSTYQEALTTIARHANAKTVFSKLQMKCDQVILTIVDDWDGFDMQTLALKKTLGLSDMKKRRS
jgi:PAS domain-containing protein